MREELFFGKKISGWFHVLSTLQTSGLVWTCSSCSVLKSSQGRVQESCLLGWCHCCSEQGGVLGNTWIYKFLCKACSLWVSEAQSATWRAAVWQQSWNGGPEKEATADCRQLSVVLCWGTKEEADSGHHCFLSLARIWKGFCFSYLSLQFLALCPPVSCSLPLLGLVSFLALPHLCHLCLYFGILFTYFQWTDSCFVCPGGAENPP